MLVVRASLGPSTRVPANPKHRRRVLDIDQRQEGSQEHLSVGSVASRVGDSSRRSGSRTIVEFC